MRPKTEIGRRISAALTLAQIDAAELGRRMEGDGLKRRDPEEIMQGRKTPQRAHYDSMARHLGVPVEWLEADDFFAWLSRREPSRGETQDLLQRIDQVVTALATNAGLGVVAQQSEQGLRRHSGSAEEATRNG